MILLLLTMIVGTVTAGPCSIDDGSAGNSESCTCGTIDCDLSTLFCLASTSTCNSKIMCSVTNGTSVNSGNCACGMSDCDSSTGLFCDVLNNKCSEVANKFTVTGTGCTTNGACFQSLNYPDNYGKEQTCSITVQSVADGDTLYSLAFDTYYNMYSSSIVWQDKLTILGTDYAGTSGPSNIVVNVNDVFTWWAGYGGTNAGFKVCLFGACLETDGNQSNADACHCGTATCLSPTGLFCTSSTNT